MRNGHIIPYSIARKISFTRPNTARITLFKSQTRENLSGVTTVGDLRCRSDLQFTGEEGLSATVTSEM